MSSDSCKNSFVKARDPSILAYNRPAANQFKENLFNLNNELSTLAHSSESENSSVSSIVLTIDIINQSPRFNNFFLSKLIYNLFLEKKTISKQLKLYNLSKKY